MAYKKNKDKDLHNVINFEDEKINVMVMGVSGSGKSTLINSIMDEEVAEVGVGDPVTDTISVYEKDDIPFRLIDTVGYEFGLFRQLKIKNELRDFCKEGIKKKEIEKLIHVIWYCIDGTSKRIDQNTLSYIKSVSNDWEGVPIIIVFTKSYSKIDIEENIAMAKDSVEKYNNNHKKKKRMNVQEIIPVVAQDYPIDEEKTVPQNGLDVLVEATTELAPKAKIIAKENALTIDLKLKQKSTQSLVMAASVAASAVGAVNITVPDAMILMPLQSAMLAKIARTYNISDSSLKTEIIDEITKAGAATLVGRTLVEQIKKIPGINIAGAVINGIVAGSITFALGEIGINLFERVYKGDDGLKKDNLGDVIQGLMAKYMPGIIDSIKEYSKENKVISVSNIKEILNGAVKDALEKDEKNE